jgi:hypothetical protein
MTYAATNPPVVAVPGIGGKPTIWVYVDGDDDATVNGSDYFTNGRDLGMKVGDILFLFDGTKVSAHYISGVDDDGNATAGFMAVA